MNRLTCLHIALLAFTLVAAIQSTFESPIESASLFPLTETKIETFTREKRDGTPKIFYDKLKTCVRNALNKASKEIECVVKRMFRILFTNKQINCKNCANYFYCMANLNAFTSCGNGNDSISAMDAISTCSDLKNLNDDDDDNEAAMEAAGFGRSNGNCDSIYLCSRGCRYSASNQTCTATCR